MSHVNQGEKDIEQGTPPGTPPRGKPLQVPTPLPTPLPQKVRSEPGAVQAQLALSGRGAGGYEPGSLLGMAHPGVPLGV